MEQILNARVHAAIDSVEWGGVWILIDDNLEIMLRELTHALEELSFTNIGLYSKKKNCSELNAYYDVCVVYVTYFSTKNN